ncbi:MAG: alpha/beta fold hydrolase [Planctomycetota bacterium]|nr:MAG: alpha/beta fold hydrolase [Planctomycetota bacterium]
MGSSNHSPRPIETVATADGARIACKRKPSDGPPVIMVHGLAVNADIWDIPDLDGPDFTYRSLSNELHALGYDVWMMNLRGHGAPHMLSTPPPGQKDWTVDSFIAYDLPAVVEHVQSVRRERPWLLGNSMGAMTIAGYLQGATITENGEPRVVGAESLAQCRQDRVRGCVLLEFPAALRWPRSLYDASGSLNWDALLREWTRNDSGANYPFEAMARSWWLRMLLRTSGQVPLRWARGAFEPGAWRESLPQPLRDALDWTDRQIMNATRRFAEAFKGTKNFQPETFVKGLLYSADHMKAGVLEQFAECVRRGAFVSGVGDPPYVYSDHYDRIACPVLLILGGRDRIANAEICREVFYDRIRSEDREIHVFDDIAHGDFEYAPVACEKVYPLICDWLERRRSEPP